MNTISHEARTDTHPHKNVKLPTQLLWEGGKEVGGGVAVGGMGLLTRLNSRHVHFALRDGKIEATSLPCFICSKICYVQMTLVSQL